MHKFLTTHWADAHKLRKWILSYGMESPKYFTIDKWYARRSIPGQWFATILMLMEIERGAPISLKDYQS